MSNRIVIVGAGPAGISAATTLSKNGFKSVIIDENPIAGGVIYRGPLREVNDMPHLDEPLQKAIVEQKRKLAEHQHNIEIRMSTRVQGPVGPNSLLLSKEGKLSTLEYEHLILATGCQERSIPFPGWQLPGVMLTGGIQLHLKSGFVKPGKRAVIVGSGPLLVLVACQLHHAGVDVAGVYEATELKDLSKEAVALLNRPQVLLNGVSMMGYLRRHNIPFKYGWGIVKAEGNESLERVAVAPYNSSWEPDTDKIEWIDTDTLGVGYGFSARSQLAQLMGVETELDDIGGVIPVTNEYQRSSIDNIYCAGDSVKLAGADVAMLEGEIAAHSILMNIEPELTASSNTHIKRLWKRRARYYRFRGAFDRANQRKAGLLSLPSDDTVICRCEQVKKRDIDEAFAEGCKDVITLKMRTRVSMGDCQGKTCCHYLYDRFNQEGLKEGAGTFRPRFPLDPIPFSAMEDEI
ncbi:NAD(P)/FAD-dependent oxidoreductase [Vibrio marisflavi]|uniref:Hydrogen cyanide synthase subunit HcnB n=1 Tax=Vibrio marisflavi CECT 7928 TaxID=634439 RepID=A0ABM8ZYS2_9VIBR|nr:FAD/NAD(P)-binding oxidoreductase [Vibrio marisflavi]CAH0536070.1 Hydrogen cyanide synthase subunit HcnB [Vibrio marisflavi CECT 7928]